MNGLDPHAPDQLGFDALLSAADSDNRARKFERETAYLPSTMEEALPFYRILLHQHHAAMLSADVDEATRLREEARKLALRLNGGEPGIIAEPDSPGNVLERETAVPAGQAPLWGRPVGTFSILTAWPSASSLKGCSVSVARPVTGSASPPTPSNPASRS